MKVSITIPAHNESKRIKRTLETYACFFAQKKIEHEFIVVLNGCTDDTCKIVQEIQKKSPTVRIIDLQEAGKGLAVITGFRDALKRENDLIGFVDADMATQPKYFYELIEKIDDANGIIASRYMKESQIFPPRPGTKEWGRILLFNPLVQLLFGLRYADFQCGAKLFKRHVIEDIADQLTIPHWAFDVELLYQCKKNDFKIKEVPTVWHDQDHSKFSTRAGLHMIVSLFPMRFSRAKK